MKTIPSILQYVTLIVVAGLTAAVIYLYSQTNRIAYVRSANLVEKYQGTIEARSRFEQKRNSMQATVDSLRQDFERSRIQYINHRNRLSTGQQQEQEQLLGQQQNRLIEYSQVMDEKIEEEDQRMMQEVLNQINTYVEEYAEANGYDVILGTTHDGSLLYGAKGLDITEVLLAELNEHYKGK